MQGGDVDLDGDGVADVNTAVDVTAGTRVVTVPGAAGPILTYTYSTEPTRLDVNGDGSADFTGTSERMADDTQAEYLAYDTDFDGTEDLHVVRSFTAASDPLARQFSVTVERLSGDPPEFRVVSTRAMGPARESLGDGICEGMIDRPSHSGDHVRPLPGYPGVGINVNGEPGSCSLDEAARIMRALRGVVGQELACLANVHPADAVALANALAMSPLDISCGNRCCLADGRCSNANTTLPGSWRSLLDGGETMSLQMSKLRTDEALRENLMHELLHYAGVDHPEGPDGHGGTDEVYSCGRYCNRCTHNSNGAGQDMLDCLRCADPAHKTKCGSYYEIEQQPPYAPAICHGGIGANASCNKWVVEVIKACTGDVLARGAQCCAECPESTPNNDFPCNFPMPPPLQHCMPTDKPFGC